MTAPRPRRSACRSIKVAGTTSASSPWMGWTPSPVEACRPILLRSPACTTWARSIRGHVRLIFTVADVATEESQAQRGGRGAHRLFSAPVEELVDVATHAVAAAQAERSELGRIRSRVAALRLETLAGKVTMPFSGRWRSPSP